ncbi:two-component system, OmpR family, sensor histidine kinase ChvG [Litoreibacter albidus]|uniref:histidine kinase n=2 Tax=Litoreibacter albidus TaxID=670155 RepID=A0A1H2UQE1_9RHOB|nr:two-component system, OmpR family, sensor histidine kinase ChvG [Litoreibacter albidus]
MASSRPAKNAELVMGEDWTRSGESVEQELRTKREKRNLISLNRSPLARKIITFNLLALVLLVAGVLFLNPFRDSLVAQREVALVSEAQLIADVFEAQIAIAGGDASIENPSATLSALDIAPGVEVYVFSTSEALLASTLGADRPELPGTEGLVTDRNGTAITGFLNSAWETISGAFGATTPKANVSGEDEARRLLAKAALGETQIRTGQDGAGGSIFSVATPIEQNGQVIGVVALSTVAGQIDQLVRSEREQVLQMFVIAILVSIGLSLVLASTIANPLSDLAAAAELGQDKNARKVSPSRVRIPDLTARPDEIGRLSGAMRGMVSALYERIDANEQFAADVAHEIKNPLASLRSAVGTLRVAKTDEQRGRLLDVIEHDVRRLDRLVSDISNASRLDSELVKEDEEPFDLMKMINNLTEYLGQQAAENGVEFIRDVPNEPIIIHGLEARLAQVFVNLITNATSFCEAGDAVRIWARRRDDRILVVVEDTGPGIPEQALNKVFNRFYSERPERQFGNHSGLGLAISKQIIEAHGGVIWAENIRPTDADVTSEPLGARFVVGLPT